MRSLEPDVLPVGEGNPKDHVMTDMFSVRRDAFRNPKACRSQPGHMNYTNCPWVSNIDAMQMLEYLTLQADNNDSMSVRTSFDIANQFVFYYVFIFLCLGSLPRMYIWHNWRRSISWQKIAQQTQTRKLTWIASSGKTAKSILKSSFTQVLMCTTYTKESSAPSTPTTTKMKRSHIPSNPRRTTRVPPMMRNTTTTAR